MPIPKCMLESNRQVALSYSVKRWDRDMVERWLSSKSTGRESLISQVCPWNSHRSQMLQRFASAIPAL